MVLRLSETLTIPTINAIKALQPGFDSFPQKLNLLFRNKDGQKQTSTNKIKPNMISAFGKTKINNYSFVIGLEMRLN